VEPYSDSIFYINLKKIHFIEFNILTDLLPISKSLSTFNINKKLRFRRTHFLKLVSYDENNLEKFPSYVSSEGEFLFNFGVPRLFSYRKMSPKVLEEERSSFSDLSNLANRLEF
jgi:hypothetical protein